VKAIVDTEPRRLSDIVTSNKVDTEMATLNAARRTTTPDKLSRLLRGDLDTIVATALKKNPQERYPSATALADDLGRYLKHEPITARPDTLAYRSSKFLRRNRMAVALASLALVAAAAGVTGTLIQARTARVQRDFAYRQLSRAEAVNELNNFLLSDAAPRGKPFTVDDLLERAEHIVERQYTDAANRLELLISIGRQYSTQDETTKARRVLDEAYRLSRGLSDHSTRSKASCALADVLSVGGELPRAESLFQEGLLELPNQPQYTLARVFCLLRGAEIASYRGESQTTIDRVRAAQHLLDESVFRSDLEDLHIFINLAEAYRNAGQYREAIAAFEQASRLTNSLGRGDTENAGTLYNNWAMALFQAGRPLDAEPIFRRAIEISRADNTDEAVSPMLLLNYGRTLRELGRLDQAADDAERAFAMAQDSGQQVVINQSLIEMARIYREKGDLDRALAMLAEVEPKLRRVLPGTHYAFAGIASERSLVSLSRGDVRGALTLANEAVAIDEEAIKTGKQGAGQLPVFLLRRSTVELQAKRSEDASVDADRAVKLLNAEAQLGTFSCNLGRAYLALARALDAQNRRDEARSAAFSAAEQLQNTLGPNQSDTLAARQLAETDNQPR
jgi:serine/threonine-protein kinase